MDSTGIRTRHYDSSICYPLLHRASLSSKVKSGSFTCHSACLNLFLSPLSLLLPFFPTLLFLSIDRHFFPPLSLPLYLSLSLSLSLSWISLFTMRGTCSWRALSEDQAHYTSKYVYKKSILTFGAAEEASYGLCKAFFLNIFMRVMFLFSCDCTCIGCLKLRGKRREG
ncbi:unnamed protein product [Acanthosepion pharaonis]|uniref:Uncharacterized protein n=1 Tax=Acanthosepion pharaonis TaxID=158019 RepID=A0A812BV99_ACAPH|nr:unnamed protein product [Sepia pharaonis]